MATVTKRFSFAVDLEGWAFTAGGATGISGLRSGATLGSPNDTVSPNGVVTVTRSGKSLSDGTPYWEWTGTLEDLGVPAGASVSAVVADYDWICAQYTTGAATSATGPFELRDSSGALTGTFSAGLTFSATTSWATRSGSSVSGLSLASTTTIKLRLGAKPDTGSSTSASVVLRHDWIVVTVTYTEAAAPKSLITPGRHRTMPPRR